MGGKNLRQINELQRQRLQQMDKDLGIIFDKVWGLLPPSHDRNRAMHFIKEAQNQIIRIHTEPEQMSLGLEDFS